jgi:diguanylate cyclase (GGDEF)-like protein/PAS domain S-box-containing protein
MHKLLKRQLRKSGATVDEKFLALVDQAYKDADADRALLERSLEISSREMRELYEQLEANAQRKIQQSQSRLERILHELRKHYFLYSYDKSFTLTYLSDAIEEILGYTPGEIVGTKFTDYLTDESINDAVIESALLTLQGESTGSLIISVWHKNRSKRYLEIDSYPLVDGKGEVYGVEGLARDITQQYILQQELAYLSSHDTLTGLANRSSLYTQLEYLIEDSKRHGQSFALFYIDLDNFKDINDFLGHDEGDRLLKRFAQLLQKHARSNDIAARIGGDEFILVYTDINAAKAEKLAKRLFESIQQEIIPLYRELQLSASIGIALYPKDALDAQELLKKADIALYRTKNGGKNRFSTY